MDANLSISNPPLSSPLLSSPLLNPITASHAAVDEIPRKPYAGTPDRGRGEYSEGKSARKEDEF